MKKSLLLFFILIYTSAFAVENNHYQNFLESYKKDYYDNSKTILDLLKYYHSGIKKIHIEETADGNRFTDFAIQWALNAPIQLKRISSFKQIECEELDKSYICIELIGEDTSSSKNNVTKVVLGFIDEMGVKKIGGIFVVTGKGSSYSFDIMRKLDQ